MQRNVQQKESKKKSPFALSWHVMAVPERYPRNIIEMVVRGLHTVGPLWTFAEGCLMLYSNLNCGDVESLTIR